MSTTESKKGSKHRTVEELIAHKQKTILEATERHNLRIQKLNAELQQLEDIRDGRRKHRIRASGQLSEADKQVMAEFQAMAEGERKEAFKAMKAKLRVLKMVAGQPEAEAEAEAPAPSEEEEEVLEFEEESEDDDEEDTDE